MKHLLILAGLLSALGAKELVLSQKQLNELGVATSALSTTLAFSQSNLPATVVIPPQQLSIATSMNEGTIQKIFVGVGDSVKAGQTVATVASAQGLGVQRDYLQTNSRLERLRTLVKKDEALFKEGIISEREYSKSKQELDLLTTELAEKQTSMKMMGLSTSKNGGINPAAAIKAPIGGIVLEQTALIGQKIDAMSPVFKIADLSTLWIEIQTPANVAKTLHVGDTVQTNVGAKAKIIKISNGMELQNQSVIVRGVVTSGRETLRPGQFIQVSVQTPSASSIVVPKSGLVRNNGANVIFVKSARGFTPVPVKIIKEECSTFIISGKLRGDEEIAVQGIVPLKGLWLETKETSK
ncbi:MAG: efflux RND transporter periplasmic adaptor subunit [Sulfuricurvum sp.]